jgi:membrane protein YdbS with pleckstrin-like domain
MQIHITRNGQPHGPYNLDEVNAYLLSGHLHSSDLAWYEGAAGWMPLAQVTGVQLPTSSAPPPPPMPSPAAVQPPNLGHGGNGPESERTLFEITPTITPELALTVLTCGLGLLVLAPKAIANQGCKYRLTTQRLVLATGLVARRVEEIELYRVKDVTVSQGFLGRLLGFGTVIVHGNDSSTPRLTLSPINNPTRIKEQIRDASRRSRRTEGVRSIEYGSSS